MNTEELLKLIKQCEERIVSLFKNEEFRDAIVIAEQVLKINPDNLCAMQICGLCYFKLNKTKKAIELFEKALEIEPDNSENLNNISLCHSTRKEYDKSIPYIQKAIELNPKHIYYRELGIQYANINEFDKAVENLNKAIELNANDHQNWMTLGNIYGNQLDVDKAMFCFRKSLSIKEDPETRINLAYGYFLKKDWENAWKEYESRLDYFVQIEYFNKIYPIEKRWKGENLNNKRIVVYCEQGVGDFINFVRFIDDLKEQGCTVLLHTPKDISDLMELNDFGDIRKESFENNEYDYHCSLLSLPYYLKIKNFKKNKIYIQTDKKIDFEKYKNFYKIGIAWGGSPLHPNDRNRSCELSLFKEINDIPNVKLFGLQKDIRKRAYIDKPEEVVDLTANCEEMKIILMSEQMNSFSETAAILNELDLIVTVDTSLLHLAGAMGKETWAIIPYVPDWRWGLNSIDNDWYKSVKLFRQTTPNDWTNVFKEIRVKIENILSNQ